MNSPTWVNTSDFIYCKCLDGSMFSVHNCINSTFEYKRGIKFDDTIIG